MEINYNIISLFDIIALVQGVVFGLILIFKNQTNRPTLYLGLFLLTYSINLANAILSDSGLLLQRLYFIFLPINFFFLTIPFLYIYTNKLIQPISAKAQVLVLTTGIVEFLIFTGLYFLPKKLKRQVLHLDSLNTIYVSYQLISIIFSIVFLILIIKIIGQNQTKVLNYYSNAEAMQLKWVKNVALIILIYFVLSSISLLSPVPALENNLYYFLSFGNLIFIYWIGISGIRQERVDIIDDNPKKTTSSIDLDTAQDKTNYKNIHHKISQEQLFKNPELNLPELANYLGFSRRELSRLINKYSGTNFNNFMNQFRVNQAMRILADKANNQLNMVGVADEVGFKSKATFFTAFKKITGKTPGQYKRVTQTNKNAI